MRRLGFPLRLDTDGHFATVEQHTAAHADQQMTLVRITRPGDRIAQPTVGVVDPTGQPDAVITERFDVAVDRQVTAGTRTGPSTVTTTTSDSVTVSTPIRSRRP